MVYRFLTAAIFSLLPTLSLHAQPAFKVVVLGCHGGPKETNISGYLIASHEGNEFIALDAGSLLHGIEIASAKNSFQEIKINPDSDLNFEVEILQNHIKGYLISHAHLEHVSGLVICSAFDSEKPIFGIDSTIDYLRDHLFNWKIWPNFGSEGTKPLHQYQYTRLTIGEKIPLPAGNMTVEPHLLSHHGSYECTAFIVGASDSYVVYFGDTSPDALESEKNIEKVWRKIAPLIRKSQLRAIFLECSYSDKTPACELYGHLNPEYMMEELERLAFLVDPSHPETALQNVKIVVTHIKDSHIKGVCPKDLIQEDLKKRNQFNLEFIFPEQGQKLEF
ncbi:MAG: 3',5'-cyclic-nucleotide phosphodiesterase [Chlamydiae bacterium]|nr:3',5'-cyclic-nucleotide phosphodiesterase [Chlamydiota bacterium]